MTKTHYEQDVNAYVTQAEFDILWSPHEKKYDENKIINFIRKKMVHPCVNKKDRKSYYKYHTISIHDNIKTRTELRKWLYVYIKVSQYYTAKYSTDGNSLMSTFNPISLYEILGYVVGTDNCYEIYKNTPLIMKEHTNRPFGYTFHTINLETFKNIVYEMTCQLIYAGTPRTP